MRIALFSATLLASGLATAAMPIDGWYSSAFGGYSYLPNNINKNYRDARFNHGTYKNGYNAGGRIGFQSSPLRYEGEFTYTSAKVHSFRVNRIEHRALRHRANGQSTAALGMANVYYDFPEMVPCIAPFIGVGLGYGWVETTLRSEHHFQPTHFKGSDSAFAYQASAGFTYNFAENYALNIAYRYVGTTNINSLGKIFQANLSSVGVIYRFNEYNYK